jgi:predicted metal-dependent HD superfamily phosphohydrolase
MPKVQHEILHQFLRDCPEILRRLLPGSLGIVWNDSTQVAVASVDFTDATPTEYRADSCVIVNGPPKTALVLEAQLNIAPEKPTQWLKYAAAVRHTHGCDAYVVVLTLKPEVERWARKPVVLNNSCTFWPVVIGPSVLGPRGFADIEELPALSVLTVMASAGSPDYERIVVRGIKRLIRLANRKNARLARAQARLYIDLIMSGLSPARQQYLKEKMENERPKYYSWAFNQSYDDGGDWPQERKS